MMQRYPQVEEAMAQGDTSALQIMGRVGGQKAARKRAAERALLALLRGRLADVAKPKKPRPRMTVKALLALRDFLTFNKERLAEECRARDADAHLNTNPLD